MPNDRTTFSTFVAAVAFFINASAWRKVPSDSYLSGIWKDGILDKFQSPTISHFLLAARPQSTIFLLVLRCLLGLNVVGGVPRFIDVSMWDWFCPRSSSTGFCSSSGITMQSSSSKGGEGDFEDWLRDLGCGWCTSTSLPGVFCVGVSWSLYRKMDRVQFPSPCFRWHIGSVF